MYATYHKGYKAHTTDGSIVSLPDAVHENQKTYAAWGPDDYTAEEIEVLNRDGKKLRAVLRGDLYGLGTPGTDDPIVKLVED